MSDLEWIAVAQGMAANSRYYYASLPQRRSADDISDALARLRLPSLPMWQCAYCGGKRLGTTCTGCGAARQ